jgi:uncharacterized protein (DUF1015 family)
MRIKSFCGLVPGEGKTERVASVPYDVVNVEEARALADGNAESLLNVSRAEIQFPEGVDPYSEQVYARAKSNFDRLTRNGSLVRESGECMYLYRQRMGGHSQVGIVAVAHVDDYENEVILKHEKTRPAKEDDRTRLASEIGAHLGPVFLTYRGHPKIDAAVSSIIDQSVPQASFTAEDGIQHEVWRIADSNEFTNLFSSVEVCYVADGHHRSASAARVCSLRKSGNADHTGQEDYNWFLVVLFPADQLNILPYNRVVKDLNDHDPEELLRAISKDFQINDSDIAPVNSPGKAKMYLSGQWYELSWENPGEDPVSSLDVSVLQDRLLHPILGVKDPRTDSRIDFVGGIRGNEELQSRVDSGKSAVAFSLYQVSIDQLMSVADAGHIMPPKSTWFEPKLRSGLFIHTF